MQEAQVADVNPEFLAALPLNIQEEVLAQQRMEQQRQAAAAANPNDPVNAAEFFQNLQPSLRQAVSRNFKKYYEEFSMKFSILDSRRYGRFANCRVASRARRGSSKPSSRLGNKKSSNARTNFNFEFLPLVAESQ